MLTIQQAQRLLRTGAISSEQLVLYCHARATAGNNWNNAYERTVDQHTLVQQARQSDARRQQGTLLSPLDGIPFSVKANLAVASQPLTAGSDILRTAAAAASVGYNAQVVEAMLSSGAVLTGTTAMDEFGMGSLGTNRSKGMLAAVKNPMKGWHGHDRQIDDEEMKTRILSNNTNNTNNTHSNNYYYYSPGGSSSGSAVSVAQSAALVSLASDTGGSVRLPAAWCGIAGYKPAYGTLSRDGLVAYASSLDTVGILAPTAECIAVVMKQLLFQQQTQPRRDSTLRKQQSVSHSKTTTTTTRLEGFKVAIPTSFVVKEMPPEIRDNWWNAAQQLERQGATIHIDETISPRILQQALAAYYVLACAEASSNLARYDGFRYGQAAHFDLSSSLHNNNHTTLLEQQYAHTRTLGFGPEVIRRILCGTAVLSSNRYHSHYEAAAKLRAVLALQMRSVLNEYDVLLVPTTLHPPLRLDDLNNRNNNSTESMANDIMTVPGSLGGFPCLAVPYGQWKHDSSHRPPCAMSVQFIAAQHDDAKLFQAAAALQEIVV